MIFQYILLKAYNIIHIRQLIKGNCKGWSRYTRIFLRSSTNLQHIQDGVQKDESWACACFSLHSGLPHGPKWRTNIEEVSTIYILFLLSDFICFKGVNACFVYIYVDVSKRRPPQKGQKRRNDIYVNRKTDFAAQLERCQKLLDSRFVTFLAYIKLVSRQFKAILFIFIYQNSKQIHPKVFLFD